MSDYKPPANDEIEVSIFGRGYGESILIHVGDARWIAIDSVASGENTIASVYLNEIGHPAKSHLDLIIATHWHDDHIRNISTLFTEADNAEFVFPLAMLKKEFIGFAAKFAGNAIKSFGSGVEEFGRVLDIASARQRPSTKWPLRGAVNGGVHYRPAKPLSHGSAVALEALSPSHFDVQVFLAQVGLTDSAPGGALLQAPRYGANDVSSAFWLQVGGDGVLLGADVEEINHVNSGWNGILTSSTPPPTKASLVKVPHHGGVSGHNPAMWSNLVRESPVASLTPWALGRNSLPSATDVVRIRRLAGESYSTNRAKFDKSPDLKPMVRKLFAKGGITPKRVNDELGHIRHRAKTTGTRLDWVTELFGRACELGQMTA